MIKHTSKYTLLFIVAALLLVFLLLTATAPGLRLLLSTANTLAPKSLHVTNVEGRLNSTVTIGELDIHSATQNIQLQKIKLKIQPLALFIGELRVLQLSAENVHIVSLPQETKVTTGTAIPHLHLPIRIKIEQLHINHLESVSGDATTVVNAIQLRGVANSHALTLDTLTFDTNGHHASLQGSILFDPIAVNLHLRVDDGKQTVLDTALRGDGTWDKLTLLSDTQLPLVIHSQIHVQNVLSHPAWQLTGTLNSDAIGQFNPTLASLMFTGQFDAHGDAQTTQFNATLHSSEPSIAASLIIHAKHTAQANTAWQVDSQWQNLSWPLLTENSVMSHQGELHATQQNQQWQIATNFALMGSNIPDSTWKIVALLQSKQLTVSHLHAELLDGTLDGDGSVDLTPPHAFTVNAQAHQLDPGQKWLDWPGQISLQTKLQGDAKTLALQLSNIHGQLRQQPLSGNVLLQVQQNKPWHIDGQLQMGAATAQLRVLRDALWHVNWNIRIPDLTKITPYGTGTLNTRGQIQGSTLAPVISGSIQGQGLAYHDYQLNRINSRFDLNLNSNAPSLARLTASGIHYQNYALSTVALTASGNPLHHKIELHIVGDQQQFNTTLNGQYHDKTWWVSVPVFTLESPDNGDWTLTQAAQFYLSDTAFDLSPFRWQNGQQHLLAALHLEKSPQGHWLPATASLDISQFNLKALSLLLPDEINLQGELNAQATLTREQHIQQMQLSANLQHALLRYIITKQDKQLDIPQVSLNAQLNKQGLRTQFTAALEKSSRVDIALNFPQMTQFSDIHGTAAIEGHLNGNIDDLSFLEVVLPQIADITGHVRSQLQWSGTLNNPEFNGSMELSNGGISLPITGLLLSDVQAKLTAEKNALQYRIDLHSGEGNLKATGNTQLAWQHTQTKIHVEGDQFTISNTPEYQVVISPDVTITLAPQRTVLNGSILIPSAHIHYADNSDIVSLPNDVNISYGGSNSKTNHSALTALYTKLNIRLGDDVYINIFNLNSQVRGHLVLMDDPQTITHATGELTLNKGTYTAFGQKLEINDGKLLFAGGSVENPGLDIRATKQIRIFVSPVQNSIATPSLIGSGNSSSSANLPLQAQTLIVGASITSTLMQPTITLFSNQPGLSQADILSYLVLGFPLSNASNQQGQALWTAASALSASNSDMTDIMKQLKGTFQLNSIGFESSSFLNSSNNTVQQNTSLALGKMLSPRLYIKYSIGLLEPINTISAAYTLNEHWTAQTESSTLGNGVDLIYSWET